MGWDTMLARLGFVRFGGACPLHKSMHKPIVCAGTDCPPSHYVRHPHRDACPACIALFDKLHHIAVQITGAAFGTHSGLRTGFLVPLLQHFFTPFIGVERSVRRAHLRLDFARDLSNLCILPALDVRRARLHFDGPDIRNSGAYFGGRSKQVAIYDVIESRSRKKRSVPRHARPWKSVTRIELRRQGIDAKSGEVHSALRRLFGDWLPELTVADTEHVPAQTPLATLVELLRRDRLVTGAPVGAARVLNGRPLLRSTNYFASVRAALGKRIGDSKRAQKAFAAIVDHLRYVADQSGIDLVDAFERNVDALQGELDRALLP